MKKHLSYQFLIAMIIVSPFILFGQSNNFSGHISNDTTWANTVLVTGNVYIDNGSKLTISPGTTIEFQGFYKTEVNGSLQAIGTATDTITFTVADTTGFSNYANSSGAWDGLKFDHVAASNDSSIFKFCKIQYSKAVDPDPYSMGGAILYLTDTESKLEIRNCLFQNNIAPYDGGAISIRNFSSVSIIDNIFRNNRSLQSGGGAIDITGGNSALIRGNIIYDNQADWGGGISIGSDSHSHIVNNLIYNNFAGFYGGGFLIGDNCFTRLTNNTICNNSAWQNSGGIHIEEYSSPILKSNIIWGNTAQVSPQCEIADNASEPDFYNCDIQGGFAGIGGNGAGGNFSGTYQDNIDSDPLFLNQTAHPYKLSVISSPCVDAGFPDTTGLFLPEKDLAGNTRVYTNWENSLIDIGAYEFQKTPQLVSFSPEDESVVNDLSVDLTIELDGPIAKQSGNIIVYNENGTVYETIPAANSSINSHTATIPRTKPFLDEHSYYIIVENTAFDDGYGNYFAGIYDNTTWNITAETTDNFAGNALDFDGGNDYVRIDDDNSLDLTNNYTIEAWIKPSHFDSRAGIVSKYQNSGAHGYFLRLHPDSPHTGLDFDGMKTSNGILEADKWYHIAAVNDNGTRKLYLNGELQNLSGTTSTVQSNTDYLTIGVDFLQEGRYFQGEIDEVRLWNIVRTESEIRENINIALSGFEAGLVSYWQFNESIGTFTEEPISSNNGVLRHMNDDDHVASGVAVGSGTCNTQTVSSTGVVDFTGTGISLDFTQKTGSDTYVITKLDAAPNIIPERYDNIFDSQYWIFRKYGSGTFNSNIYFTPNEGLYANDENSPSIINLYKRDSNSETDWILYRYADSVNASANFALYNSINDFSQFLLTRYDDIAPPILADTYPKDNSYINPTDSLQIITDDTISLVNGKSFYIYDKNNVLWNTYTIPSTQITFTDGIIITIHFGSVLSNGNYHIQIDSAAFTDHSNNSFAGINNNTAWDFVVSDDGNLTADTTWVDYTYIYRDIFLNDGNTLEITPGTRVEFLGSYLLDIQGRLLAQGAKNDSIIFTTPSSSHHWNRLHFNNTPVSNDTSKISYCIFENGHTSDDGGAIYINNVDKLIINRSTIRHNYAYTDGGGIYIGQADPVIQNNIFHDNQTQLSGGAVTLYYSNPIITGNLFHHNKTWNYGGAVYFNNSSPHFINNTLVYNFSSVEGGGIDCRNNSNPVIENSIIYHNTRYGGQDQQVNILSCDPDFYYCDIGPGFEHFQWDGENLHHVNENPLFAGSGEHPYSLQKISPIIDIGNPGTTTDTIGEFDIAGTERIMFGRVDIGAYELGRISDGYAGTALEFAGTNDYVCLPDNGGFDFSSSFTVETWVNFGSMTEGEHTIIKNGTAWKINVLTVPNLAIIEFGVNDNETFVSAQTDQLPINDTWNHIACVFDPGMASMTIYLNGIQGSTDFAMPISTPCDSITFGGDFVGKIDEFRVWNTARTIDQIRENMHLTLSDLTAGLTTFLQFNEGSGTTVLDLATGYEGTLNNMSVPQCWVNSTMPVGEGVCNSQIVYATGNQSFTGTGISLDFTEKMWSDTIVVTKIENGPNSNPTGANAVFDNSYRIIEKYGSGTFKANMSYTIDNGYTADDQASPELIKLYRRPGNSDKYWKPIAEASSVNQNSNTAVFNGLTSFSQFITARKPIPDNFPGKVISFDGIDDEVDFGNNESLDITEAMTVEIWIKAENINHNFRILHKGSNKFLDWDSDYESISGKGIQLNIPGLNTGWWEFQYDMDYGQWYHIAWTLDNNGLLTAYVNGEIVRQETFSGSIITNTDDLLLANPDGSSYWFEGLFDEFRIWNTTRTSEEIKENMYLVLSGTEPGLISYWQFNKNTGKTLTDRAGGNIGALRNITNDAWIASSIPFGGGKSNTHTVSSTGVIDFSGTDVTIDFTEKTGTDTIVVTRIDTVPNIDPIHLNSVFDDKYWVVNKYGTGTYNSDITFMLQNNLSEDDESNPHRIRLFTRGSSTDTNWVYVASASSVNVAENKATFEDISGYGQFIIGRKETPGNYPGEALSFDGIDDYVSVEPDPSLDNSQFTVEFWTRSENPGTWKGIIDKGRDSNSDWYFLTGDPGETRGVIFGAGNGSSTIELMNSWNDNNWHHVAGTYNGSKMSLYIDGIKTASANISIDITANNITFGSRRDGSSFFNGTLDEVRIWDVALTRQEIRENMHLTSYESQPGLVSYWQFNEETGSIAFDYNKTNSGTMVNMEANSRVLSTVATGSGFSNTQTEADGIVDFTGTGFSMDFSYQNGASVTVTRIDTVANIAPTNTDIVFTSQYWVVDRFSSGMINTDLTFTVNENLTSYDEGNPGNVKLYTRESNSDESWMELKAASYVDAAANTATFEGITGFSQFMLGKDVRTPDNFPGTALAFDGINDHVNGTGIDTSLSAITIEAWVYHNSLPGTVQRYVTISPEVAVLRHDGTAYGGFHELHFYIKQSNGSFCGIRVDSIETTNEWMHIAGTYDGNEMKLYLNGELIKSATPNDGGLFPPNGDFEFSASGSTMDGKMDEVRIWDHARSQQEIKENMHLSLTGKETGLRHNWQFNDSSGTNVTDIAGGNDATMHNMAGDDWIASSIPFGGGVSNTQEVSTTGTFDFTNTDVSMDFTAKTGSDIILVSKIDTVPNINPTGVETVFDKQYWTVHKYGNGTFNTNITFMVGEDFTVADETNPAHIKLYTRGNTSDTNWVYLTDAISVDAANNSASFTEVSRFGQFIIVREERIEIELTVFLEGPFNGTDMNTSLNPDDIPLAQPYNVAPWNYTGTESVDSIPTDVVDWVLIELRDTTDAALATGETVIARQAAFIKNDGKIVDTAGTDARPCVSRPPISNNLFVVIYHRNHLGIMSANPVTESGGVYTYDFTTPSGKAYGTDAQKDLGSGVYGMVSADANADGDVNAADKTIWENQAGEEGYKSADFDLDGQVSNPDKNDKWVPNEGKGSQVPD